MKAMKKTIKISLLLVLVNMCFSLNAQQQDFQTRLGLAVSSEFASDWGWSVEAQQRWFQNSTTFDRTILSPGISYAPLDFMKVGVGYRLTWLNFSDINQEVKQRINADINLRHKLGRVRFNYRSRFQYGFDDFQTIIVSAPVAFKWRNKIGLKYYPFGIPFRPTASVEIFYNIDAMGQSLVDGVRYQLGTEVLLSDKLTISLDYLLDKEINVKSPLTENVLSCSLSYEF